MPESANEHREWSPAETEAFYSDLLERAMATIPESGAVMVLGPMFIIRKPEENFARFAQAQEDLKLQGMSVFDQLPFVDHNIGVGNAPFKYDVKFELFYKKLIQSGKIKGCYLLPGWEQSQGTKSEIEYARSANVPVIELA